MGEGVLMTIHDDRRRRRAIRYGLAEPEPEEPTLKDLRARAKELDIEGRSKMDRDELAAAIAEASGESESSGEPEE
jgi:hypothetical protein